MRVAPLFVAALTALAAQTAPSGISLMPWPSKIAVAGGRMPLPQNFQIRSSKPLSTRVQNAVARAITRISTKTGMPMIAAAGSTGTALDIAYANDTSAIPKLGDDESYRLQVSATGAKLDAASDLGVLRGLETFTQLVRADAESFSVPVVAIDDRPRFPWRGLHLDVARHWLPIDVVKRTLDGMAAVKLNVFHWHLSDDQGFRIESKRYPKLQGMGSDGNYFTQDQAREVIAYAAERGIRVVPEFDVPGHATSWLVGYPELAAAPGPYSLIRTWGIFDPTLDPTNEAVYTFLDGFFGEMAALFPDEYLHIGGDEVNGKQWRQSEQIQKYMKEHHLADNGALHAYFNQRVLEIVSKHGKKMEGWDEILAPGLQKDVMIQSWRGPKSLAQAAQQGYRGILSSGYYLDLIRSAATHYAVDPMQGPTAALNGAAKALILGGEACMWSEYVTPEDVDSRIWPRAAAIAERFWSPQEINDPASMYRRLDVVSAELERIGLTHRSSYRTMLERIAGGSDIEAVKAVADVAEPVKEYNRERRKHQYTQSTPLNRLVDAARPESDRARDFRLLVTTYLDTRQARDRDAVRQWLTRWSNTEVNAKQHASAHPSFLLDEVIAVSAELSAAGRIGLEAMDMLDRKTTEPPAWMQQSVTRLQAASKANSEVLIMVIPDIERLVRAAGK